MCPGVCGSPITDRLSRRLRPSHHHPIHHLTLTSLPWSLLSLSACRRVWLAASCPSHPACLVLGSRQTAASILDLGLPVSWTWTWPRLAIPGTTPSTPPHHHLTAHHVTDLPLASSSSSFRPQTPHPLPFPSPPTHPPVAAVRSLGILRLVPCRHPLRRSQLCPQSLPTGTATTTHR